MQADTITKYEFPAAEKKAKAVCPECGKVTGYTLKKRIRKYVGEDYQFELPVFVPVCNECGSLIAVEEIEEKITQEANAKIRESRGIISEKEIRELLKTYDVSQKTLSRLLGWGEITLTRYLTGGLTPGKKNSDRLKSLKNPYCFQKILNDGLEEHKIPVQEEMKTGRMQNAVNARLSENQEKIVSVIHWFLNHAEQEDPITKSVLNKLLYFSQAWSLVWNENAIFDETPVYDTELYYPSVSKLLEEYPDRTALPKTKISVSLTENEIKVLEFVKSTYYDVYSAIGMRHLILSEVSSERTPFPLDKESIRERYESLSKNYHIFPKRHGEYIGC